MARCQHNNPCGTWIGLALAGLACLAGPTYAQERFEPYGWKAFAADSRAYAKVKEHYAEAIADGRMEDVVCGLAQTFRSLPVWNADQEARGHFQRQIDAACDEFRAWLQTRLDQRRLDQLSTGRFKQAHTDEGWFYFHRTPDEIDPAKMTRGYGEEIAYRAEALDRLMVEFKEPMRKRTLKAIEAAKARWATFIDKGYSQYPWEMYLNGRLIDTTDIEHPPSHQWIFLHPSLGVELSGQKFSSLTAKEALTVQTVGHLWYGWKKKEEPAAGLRWIGLSGVVSLRSDVGTGVGVMAHWGKLVNIGVVWHDFNRDGKIFNDRAAINLGIDLYRFAKREIPERKRAVEAKLESYQQLFQAP